MFDVFYTGPKPNLFPFEREVSSLEEAASLSKTECFWCIYGGNDYTGFNFHVTIAPWEITHVYVYGSQWQKDAGVYLAHKNHAPNKTWHFRSDQNVTRLPCYDNWTVPDYVKSESVDFSWHPDPHEPEYTYHFPSKFQSSSGVTYYGGSDVIKITDAFIVETLPTHDNWTVPDYVKLESVDFSWHPNPLDPPYTYHFPSMFQSSSGVTYNSGSDVIKITDAFIVDTLPTQDNWEVPETVDVATVQFNWHPNPLDPPYVYHFSDDYQETSGLVYTVPGATDIKIIDAFETKSKAPDIFFVDKSNQQSASRFKQLKERFPEAQKIRYANSMMDTIKRCIARSKTTRFWVISSENIYDDFDFAWHPNSWQSYMTHVFGSKLQKWSDTYLINKFEFERNSQWANSIAEFPNLNFVDNQFAVIPEDLYDVYYLDHMNTNGTLTDLKNRFPNIKSTRFVDNYLDTLKRVMSTATTEYVWVTSSICNYSRFDFSWQPEPWQDKMLHVFASNKQKFGDTFYIHVPTFKEQMDTLELLEWFNTVNFTDEQIVPRVDFDVVKFESDALVDSIKGHHFTTPFATFSVDGTKHDYTPSVWRKKDRNVHVFAQGGSVVTVPRDIQPVLSSQVYDYPHILKHRDSYLPERALDIIFISNGEPRAEELYEHTCNVAGREVKWIKDINSRVKANHAAAEASTTEWFFAATGKLEIADTFNFNWQPDRLQQPKHYIFNAYNPVNNLVYGHQGLVAWNKKLVLNTVDSGLDFTMSQAHEVIPIISGTAHFNMDPLVAWRTAFREVVKLCYFYEQSPTIDTEHRIDTWLDKANGLNAQYVLDGAYDGRAFFVDCRGDLKELMKSFEHDWLRSEFTRRYGK